MKTAFPLPVLLAALAAFAAPLLNSFAAQAEESAATLTPAPQGFDQLRDGISRGKIEAVEYDSKTVGGKRKAVIWTSPGYSQDSKYPTLYLLHGIGDDETGWQKKGSADVILDNLVADKKIVPMVVVMPNGFARPLAQPSEPAAGEKAAGDVQGQKSNGQGQKKGRGGRGGRLWRHGLARRLDQGLDSLRRVALLCACQPRAAGDFRSLDGRRAETLNIGLKNLGTFASVGGFSSALFGAQDIIPEGAAEKLKLLWVSCGDTDRLMDGSRSLHEALTTKKVPHVWHIDSGGHNWPVWKNDLYLISQKLFRDQ